MPKITVEYNGEKHELEVELDDTVEILQLQIHSVFPHVPPEKQSRFAIGSRTVSAANPEVTSLQSLGIKDGDLLTILHEKPKPVARDTGKKITFTAPVVAANPQQQGNMTRRIESSFMHTRIYEDPSLQQKIRALVPLAELEQRAKSDTTAPAEYDFRDRLLLQLLHWFKHTFFKWTNQPPCSTCGKDEAGNMNSLGGAQPTPEESKWQAFMVEVYSCKSCGSVTRFPRYNHPEKLLQTRCGRCGEWANTFTAVCRALGFEARHVVDFTDHVWTEVYSASQKRWMHCDACEDKLDAPLMYEAGWGKNLSYVLAFSAFEIVDVTKRYTRKWQDVLSRRLMVSEDWLEKKIDLMNQMIMSGISPALWDPMIHRKELEQKELEDTLYADDQAEAKKPEEQEGRISGSKEWKDARGESGKPKSSIQDGSCAVPGAAKSPGVHIPVSSFLLADKTNLDAVLAKIKEFNASAAIPEKNKLSSADIDSLSSLATTLRTSPAAAKIPVEHLAALERCITSWPFPNLFPLLDIARVSLLNTGASEYWGSKVATLSVRFLIFSSAAAAKSATLEIASANAMMIMRFFTNAFAAEKSRAMALRSSVTIVDSALSVASRCTKNAKQAAGLCLVNVCKALVESADEALAASVAQKLLNHFQNLKLDNEDSEFLYCLIVAAGTLSTKFIPARQAIVAALGSLKPTIEALKNIQVPKLSEAIAEFEKIIVSPESC